jgi:hypothetical protein
MLTMRIELSHIVPSLVTLGLGAGMIWAFIQ